MIRYEYTLIDRDDYDLFVSSVNERLKQGWLCQGGVYVSVTPNKADRGLPSVWYYQSVVRELDPDPEEACVCRSHFERTGEHIDDCPSRGPSSAIRS